MEVEYLTLGDLEPFSRNPKKHPESQLERIKASMQEFGWTNPILTSEDNMIVAGHGRYEAAKQLGFEKVPFTGDNEIIRNGDKYTWEGE